MKLLSRLPLLLSLPRFGLCVEDINQVVVSPGEFGSSGCPFLLSSSHKGGEIGSASAAGSSFHPPGLDPGGLAPLEIQQAYGRAVSTLPWDDVRSDLRKLFHSTDMSEFWPSDYGNYGTLFIRLAWHCSGSYRASDGRGGCGGGNQRFDPERSWPDNTNLDKARALLNPIKQKYGLGLSWGDLMVLAGTEAIRDMGGPVFGFCGGRIDTVDGTQTQLLGPTPEQEQFAPCEVNGDCKEPLGTNTLGLIYVNPEGPMGQPDPVGAADTIRDVFGRMGMHGREVVALIGGGHTFGKTHGACPAGAGPSPAENPENPWPGLCGDTGRGRDAFTSGFEGPWTSHPTRWDNDYFRYLIDFEWEEHVGPGGHHQWRVKCRVNESDATQGPQAPAPYPPETEDKEDVMMLTTDVALVYDTEYKGYVEEFANDITAFGDAFAKIWYELTSRDMGPVTRCVGDEVAPPQGFQFPLPDPVAKLNDLNHVMKKVESRLENFMDELENNEDDTTTTEGSNNKTVTAGKEFVRLAWQCASTFRITDYRGGCNGGRIRFAPGKDWKTNANLDQTLKTLEPIKDEFGLVLSWADLIVLSGNVVLKRILRENDHDVGLVEALFPFCPGRTDAEDGHGWKSLGFGNDNYPQSQTELLELNRRRGLTERELVALSAYLDPIISTTSSVSSLNSDWQQQQQQQQQLPQEESIWERLLKHVKHQKKKKVKKTTEKTNKKNQQTTKLKRHVTTILGAAYLREVLSPLSSSQERRTMMGRGGVSMPSVVIPTIPSLNSWAEYYSEPGGGGEIELLHDFAMAWTKMMIADRFDGPTGNICDQFSVGKNSGGHAAGGGGKTHKKSNGFTTRGWTNGVFGLFPSQSTTISSSTEAIAGGWIMKQERTYTSKFQDHVKYSLLVLVGFVLTLVAVSSIRRYMRLREDFNYDDIGEASLPPSYSPSSSSSSLYFSRSKDIVIPAQSY